MITSQYSIGDKKMIQRLLQFFSVTIIMIFISFESYSQIFSISEIDATGFPILRAAFIARTATDDPYANLTGADFVVNDNGRYVPDALVECETKNEEPEVSILLILDQSYSMESLDSASGQKRWQWVKEGATEFINTINFIGRTQMAITTFGTIASLKCPFTDSKKRLLDSLDKVIIGGGTRYDPPFLDDQWGAGNMLRQRPADMRRIAVILTDGNPNEKPKTQEIIKEMNDANIQVYSITLTLPMNVDLKEISDKTAGKWFAVYTKEQLKEIYRLIALDIQTKQFCYLIWKAVYGCSDLERIRTVDISFLRPSVPINLVKNYTAPANSIAQVNMERFLSFNDPAAGSYVDNPLVIEAANTDFEIEKITINNSHFTITDWGGTPPPFTIDSGKSRTLNVRFTQTDPPDYEQGTLLIEGLPCQQQATLVGGISQVLVVKPNGGELFSICDDVVINWTGIDPTIQVSLFYSDDNGATWNLITDKATGLSYRWKAPKAGNKYMIKAEVKDTDSYLWAVQASGTNNDIGKSLAVQDDDLYFYITGHFQDDLKFDVNNTINSTKGTDIFVAKYDPQGKLAWKEKAGSLDNDSASGVCVDGAGNAYVTGSCFQGIKFGSISPTMSMANKSYCFVARYNTNGGTPSVNVELGPTGIYTNFQAWGERVRHDYTTGITYVRGQYIGEIVVPAGKGSLPDAPVNRPGTFTATYDASMRLIKVERNGTNYPDYSTDRDTDTKGNLYRTGGFAGTINFGKYSLTSTSGSDVYITKYGTKPGSFDLSNANFTIESPEIKFAQSGVDLGDQTINNSTTKVFTSMLMNTGKLPIWISEAFIEGTNAADFSLISGIDTLMLSGDVKDIEIDFTPKATGIRTAELVIRDICAPEIRLQLTGRGICSGIALPDVDFKKQTVGVPRDSILECIFKNTNNTTVRLTPATEGANPGDFTLFFQDGSPMTGEIPLQADSCITIRIRFNPTAAGPRSAVLNYNLPDGCEEISTALIGIGVDTDLNVTDKDWGEKRVLTVNQGIVSIFNGSSLPVKVTNVEFSNPAVTVFTHDYVPGEIAANTTMDVNVVFTPLVEGLYTNSILFTIENVSEPLEAQLSGTGLLPQIITSWNCDNPAKPGETSTAYLTIENPSIYADLYVESVDFTAPTNDFEWPAGAPAGLTVEKNTNIQLPVTFKPTVSGARTAKISIISDAATGPDENPRVETIEDAICDAAGISMDNPVEFNTWLLCEQSAPATVQVYNNAGSTPIDVTGHYFSNDDGDMFTVLPPHQFTVPAGGQRAFYIVFKPAEAKEYRTTLHLVNSINVDLSSELIGSGDIIHLYSPDKNIDKEPGFKHFYPVHARINQLADGEVAQLSLQIIYNDNMLYFPNDPTSFTSTLPNWTWDTPVVSNGVIDVTGKGSLNTPFNGELFKIEFSVFLGEEVKSQIYFKNVLSPCVTPDTLGSTVSLENVCFVDGRLIKISSTPYTLQAPSPNPVSNKLNLKFGVGLDGYTRIDMVNSVGTVVKTFVDKKLSSGWYDYNYSIDDLSSGIYLLRYNSGVYVESKTIIINK